MAAWAFAGALLGAGAAWLLVPFMPAGRVAWGVDLMANLACHVGGVSLAAGAWWALRRRWCLTAAAAAAAGLSMAAIWTPRAERAAGALGEPVRVMVFNAHAQSSDPAAALRSIMSSGADIVALSEPTPDLLDMLRAPEALAVYPYRWLPDEARGGWRVMLSRWPQRWPGGIGQDGARGMVLDGATWITIVERPQGEFVFVHLHPISPRSAARWEEGNKVVKEALGALDQQVRPLQMPVVMGGDLNATPSGWRSRMIDGQGLLQRCKPRLSGGTFPAWLPRAARVAIDDVWISPEVQLLSWRHGDRGGSDHLPVVVELTVPPRINRPAGEAGRP